MLFTDDFHVNINQNMKFINLQTGMIYEKFDINNRTISHEIGQVESDLTLKFKERLPFIRLRTDFKGLKLKAMTEEEPPFISIDINPAKFNVCSQTYDVTNSVSGMFYDILKVLESRLNFSTTLLKLKTLEWGKVTEYEDGTFETTGMISSLRNGEADMICAR